MSTDENSWNSVKLPNTPKAKTNEEFTDPNEELFDDAALEQVAEKVIKEQRATKKTPEYTQMDEEDDDEEAVSDDATADETAEVDEDDGDETADQQTEAEAEEGEAEGQSEADGTEQEEGTKKTESRIPKRIEQLIGKLKEKTEREQLREYEFAQREAELLAAIQELQTQQASNVTTVAASKLKEAESAVETARRKLKAAKANVDEDAELEAIEELTEAKARQREAAALVAQVPKVDEKETRAPVNPRQVIAFRKNQAFVEANKSLLSNPLVAQTITSIDAQLQQEGFDPADDDYRAELSSRSNKVLAKKGVKASIVNPFAQEDYGDASADTAPAPTKETKAAPSVKKPINPMSKGSPLPPKKNKTVAKLDDNDKYLAHKFGIKAENLLKQRALSSRSTGDYVPVYLPSNTTKKK